MTDTGPRPAGWRGRIVELRRGEARALLSHPAITTVIPDSNKPDYMVDNLKAGREPVPDAALRKKMVSFRESLG